MKPVVSPRIVAIILFVALVSMGCGSPAQEATPIAPSPVTSDAAAPATTTAPTAAPAPTAATAAATTATVSAPARPTLAPGTYINPVLDRDFPDPDSLQVDGWYYAYATNGNGHNIQVARSQDLVQWQVMSDALPRLPKWAVQQFGWAWAPEVWQPIEGGPFIMYHVARFAIGQGGGTQCIGLATSPQPEGPYQPTGEEPIICQVGEGGSIDPATFRDDDGQEYLLWKNDGNSGGGQTYIYIQPVADDGLSLLGEPTRLLTADKAWEGVLVEAPTLWKHGGKYYLFYSANGFNTPRYATGYAVADSILGPYEKAAQPLLKTVVGAGVVGPGGQDVVLGPDRDTWLLFHAWSPAGYRYMALAPLEWEDDKPVLPQLSREPQPAP